ncbi:hypothetical protein RFI_17490, partial [Reticulomyxa filosa]
MGIFVWRKQANLEIKQREMQEVYQRYPVKAVKSANNNNNKDSEMNPLIKTNEEEEEEETQKDVTMEKDNNNDDDDDQSVSQVLESAKLESAFLVSNDYRFPAVLFNKHVTWVESWRTALSTKTHTVTIANDPANINANTNANANDQGVTDADSEKVSLIGDNNVSDRSSSVRPNPYLDNKKRWLLLLFVFQNSAISGNEGT